MSLTRLYIFALVITLGCIRYIDLNADTNLQEESVESNQPSNRTPKNYFQDQSDEEDDGGEQHFTLFGDEDNDDEF